MLNKLKKIGIAIVLISSLCIISPQASAFSFHIKVNIADIENIWHDVAKILTNTTNIKQQLSNVEQTISDIAKFWVDAFTSLFDLLKQLPDAVDMNKIGKDISSTGAIMEQAGKMGLNVGGDIIQKVTNAVGESGQMLNALDTWKNAATHAATEVGSPLSQQTLTAVNVLNPNSSQGKAALQYGQYATGAAEGLTKLPTDIEATPEAVKYHAHYVTQSAIISHPATDIGNLTGNILSQVTPGSVAQATSGKLHQFVRTAGNFFEDTFWTNRLAKLFPIATIYLIFTSIANIVLTTAEIATSAKTIALGVDLIVTEFVLAMDTLKGTQLLLNAIKSQTGGSSLKKPASQAAQGAGTAGDTTKKYVYDEGIHQYVIDTAGKKYFYSDGKEYVWNPSENTYVYTDDEGKKNVWK